MIIALPSMVLLSTATVYGESGANILAFDNGADIIRVRLWPAYFGVYFRGANVVVIDKTTGAYTGYSVRFSDSLYTNSRLQAFSPRGRTIVIKGNNSTGTGEQVIVFDVPANRKTNNTTAIPINTRVQFRLINGSEFIIYAPVLGYLIVLGVAGSAYYTLSGEVISTQPYTPFPLGYAALNFYQQSNGICMMQSYNTVMAKNVIIFFTPVPDPSSYFGALTGIFTLIGADANPFYLGYNQQSANTSLKNLCVASNLQNHTLTFGALGINAKAGQSLFAPYGGAYVYDISILCREGLFMVYDSWLYANLNPMTSPLNFTVDALQPKPLGNFMHQASDVVLSNPGVKRISFGMPIPAS